MAGPEQLDQELLSNAIEEKSDTLNSLYCHMYDQTKHEKDPSRSEATCPIKYPGLNKDDDHIELRIRPEQLVDLWEVMRLFLQAKRNLEKELNHLIVQGHMFVQNKELPTNELKQKGIYIRVKSTTEYEFLEKKKREI